MGATWFHPVEKFRARADDPGDVFRVPHSTRHILAELRSPVLAGLGYYLGTRLGFALTPLGQPNAAFWPPNAILLAALLGTPRQAWWMLLAAVFPAHMLAQLQFGVPVATSVGWFVTNTSEALIGAFCITRLIRHNKVFETVRGVFVFVAFGVFVAPFATSFFDAASVVATHWGRNYWPLSAERFWTNALAELTVVPAMVSCCAEGRSWIKNASLARCWEAGCLIAGTILVSTFIFGLQPISIATTPALLYVPLPLLFWAAIRFGAGGLGFSAVCIALISIWFTIHGREPFPYASAPQNILSLQILLCSVVLPLLFLSAVMAEGRVIHESVRRLSGKLIEAQEQERRRIARELHDDLGQELAIAQVKVSELLDASAEPLKPSLIDLSSQLSSISTTAREISHGLYPSQLEHVGLVTAIKKLCEDARRGKKFDVRLVTGNLPSRLQPPVSLCLYRVAQEALHNISSHSQAANVHVEIHTEGGSILLRVADDGIGFDSQLSTSGLGLSSMRERVQSVGGSIDITTSAQAGTRIEVRAPSAQIPLGSDES